MYFQYFLIPLRITMKNLVLNIFFLFDQDKYILHKFIEKNFINL